MVARERGGSRREVRVERKEGEAERVVKRRERSLKDEEVEEDDDEEEATFEFSSGGPGSVTRRQGCLFLCECDGE